MDAKVGDWVVTPRIGKPVEIQALWINALRVATRWDASALAAADRAVASFEARFWNDSAGCLFDVVDAGGIAGAVDASVRPNQLLAVGGLPWPVLSGEQARRVVDVVESRLWTPAGPRSLAADDPAYVGVYAGGVRERDGAYHRGTVWPWLAGAFVDAWVHVRGGHDTVKREAAGLFLAPLLAHYQLSAPGHVGEIADGDAPHAPRGCPFQAWSVGEALWMQEVLLRTGPIA
jgi:glycogen debranching enzyme